MSFGKKKYNKLVRDKIPKIIKSDGVDFKFHFANDDEYKKKLNEKLIEECNEFISNPCAEELADILEVLDSMRKQHVIHLNEVRTFKLKKREERGGFDERIILDWTK